MDGLPEVVWKMIFQTRAESLPPTLDSESVTFRDDLLEAGTSFYVGFCDKSILIQRKPTEHRTVPSAKLPWPRGA